VYDNHAEDKKRSELWARDVAAQKIHLREMTAGAGGLQSGCHGLENSP